MNKLLANRLESIQQSLMAHYNGGRDLPNDTIGEERQYLIDQYLRNVLPPLYRFGSGAILDPQGGTTGALDIVMELPFAPNFPMPTGNQRLYLSESVAAVLEVKSNLYKQWDQAIETTRRVKSLTRNVRQTSMLVWEGTPESIPKIEIGPTIPCYIIAYIGHKNAQGLAELIANTPQQSRPDGVLVIGSGAFVGHAGQTEGVSGFFHLVMDLIAQTNSIMQLVYPNLQAYL